MSSVCEGGDDPSAATPNVNAAGVTFNEPFCTTVKFTAKSCRVTDALFASTVITPPYLPAAIPAGFTDTVTVPGVFPPDGENESQLAPPAPIVSSPPPPL